VAVELLLAERDFAVFGPSHWAVIVLFVLGAVGVVVLGRGQDAETARRFSRVLAVLVLALQLAIQAYSMTQWGVDHGLPLQLSDLAAFVTAYALWSHRPWAFWLTYYWCLTLSTQALVSPALRGPDFPHFGFLAFWLIHLVVVWTAIYLTWGLRMRPSWRGYRFTVLVTMCWAGTAFVFNSIAGTNYGFLNAKPAPGSVLDLMGPWPWYLVPEVLLVLAVWALMTWPWTRSAQSRRPHAPIANQL
jgi:hypothetical integral membrane protein (TIGR02206 family)